MAAATGKITQRYDVVYVVGDKVRSIDVALIDNYTTFEDIRKIIAVRVFGNAERIAEVTIYSVTIIV